MVHHVADKADFTAQVSAAGAKLIVIDVFAPWCGPCKMIAPFFEELSKSYSSVAFLKLDGDADETSGVAEELKVNCFPTFIYWKGGKEVDRLEGADKTELEDKIKQHSK